MRILHLGRRRGKTTITVAWAIANNGYILVHDYRTRDRLIREYKNAGLKPEQVITPDDLRVGKHYGRDVTPKVSIDNLELLIHRLTGMEVDLITTSTEPYEYPPLQAEGAQSLGVDEILAKELEAVKIAAQRRELYKQTPQVSLPDFLKAAGGINADPQLLADLAGKPTLGEIVERKRQELFPEDQPLEGDGF